MLALGPHCGLRADTNLGGEVYERALCERLPAHGVDLALGVVASRPVADAPPGWSVTPVRPGRGIRWYVAPLPFLPYTVRELRRRDVDLLRGHSIRFVAPTLFAARALTRRRVPIVLHHHHTDDGWGWLEHRLLRRADGVITVSRTSAEQLRAGGVDPSRVFVVHNGVAAPATVAPDPSAWPVPDGLRLLALGRLDERKRPALALDALQAARERGVDASLVVAGDGPLRPELERRVAELGLADRVRFAGRVDEARKWALLDAADAMLFTSRLEGFGLVVAEAQVRGVPVVAPAGTAPAEIVVDGETGLLVAPTAQAYADAIARLADPQVRGPMAARAREHGAGFTWDRSAAATADAYRAIVARYRAEHT